MTKKRNNRININSIGLHKDCTEMLEDMHKKLVLKENEIVERITDNDELTKQNKNMYTRITTLEEENNKLL
jgi:hypothetical protein